MLVTSHVIAGSVVGLSLKKHPTAAFAAGVISHLLMDASPHWGTDQATSNGDLLRVARRDGCAGLTAMAALAAASPSSSRPAVVMGMMGGAIVDVDKPLNYFFGVNPFPRVVRTLHSRIQREAPHRLSYEVGVAAGLAVLAFVALAQERRQTAYPSSAGW